MRRSIRGRLDRLEGRPPACDVLWYEWLLYGVPAEPEEIILPPGCTVEQFLAETERALAEPLVDQVEQRIQAALVSWAEAARLPNGLKMLPPHADGAGNCGD